MKRTDPFSREYINKVLNQGKIAMIEGWDYYVDQAALLEAREILNSYEVPKKGRHVWYNEDGLKIEETEPMLFSDEVKEKKEVSKSEELHIKLSNAEYLTKDGKLLVEAGWGGELRIAKNPLRYDGDEYIDLNKETIEELAELQSFLKQHKGSTDAARSERMANRYAESILGDK